MNNKIWLALLNTFDGDEDILFFFGIDKLNYLSKIKVKPKAYRLLIPDAFPDQIELITKKLTTSLHSQSLVLKNKPKQFKYQNNQLVVIL